MYQSNEKSKANTKPEETHESRFRLDKRSPLPTNRKFFSQPKSQTGAKSLPEMIA
jgi:hypothetical protein